jgi:CelD/BcsL family acetyltransferase involved in cellulose biosynthesis
MTITEQDVALNVVELRHPMQGQALADEWRDLAARLPASSYFQTPDWVLSWWEDRGRPPAEIATWRAEGGRLQALVAIARDREPLHHKMPVGIPVVTNLGSGRPHQADRGGWPVEPLLVETVRRWLAEHRPRNSLLLRHLDVEGGVPLVPAGARRVARTRCPRLELTTDVDATRGRGFRKGLRNHRNRLRREGFEFTYVPPEEMTEGHIDLLFTLHERMWAARDRSSSWDRDRCANFHKQLVRRAGPGRGPAITLATKGGDVVGVEYGFLWQHSYSYYNGGWDPAFRRLSLGTVLIDETIRACAERGVQVFDFLRGIEPYKYRFGAKDRIDETWLLPRGATGRMLNMKFDLVRRAQSKQGTWGGEDRP